MKTLQPVLFCTSLLVATPAIAQIVIASDTFELPDHPGPIQDRTVVSGGVNGIKFYTRNATSAIFSLSIVDDSGPGGLGSSVLNHTDTTTTGGGSNPIIGILPQSISLSAPGDFVRLEFTFRYTNIGTTTASNTGFRFGIFGSNGTLVTGDNQPSNSNNDQGYYVQTGVGTTAPAYDNTLFREGGTLAPILGGTDRTVLALPMGTFGMSFNDNNAHTVSFTLTRTAGDNISLSLIYDSGTPITYTTTGGGNFFSYNEIAFSNGFGANPVAFNIDNVTVTTVPEPSAMGLMSLGAVGMLGLVRRRTR